MIKILLITEGPTDQLILNSIRKLFDEDRVEIENLSGDILRNKNFIKKYKTIISDHLNKEKFFSIDCFDELCIITDTDGCFIDESKILIRNTNKNIIYNDDCIICSNASLLEELKIKRSNINIVLNKNILPIYYNSCNLEHAFGSKRNNSNKEKIIFSKKFVTKYHDDLLSFVDLLLSINKCQSLNYKKSWEYISIENNSLQSASNLLLFLVSHISLLKDEIQVYLKTKISV